MNIIDNSISILQRTRKDGRMAYSAIATKFRIPWCINASTDLLNKILTGIKPIINEKKVLVYDLYILIYQIKTKTRIALLRNLKIPEITELLHHWIFTLYIKSLLKS
jgi:DNA-binding Lrp family transcriptional regulator